MSETSSESRLLANRLLQSLGEGGSQQDPMVTQRLPAQDPLESIAESAALTALSDWEANTENASRSDMLGRMVRELIFLQDRLRADTLNKNETTNRQLLPAKEQDTQIPRKG